MKKENKDKWNMIVTHCGSYHGWKETQNAREGQWYSKSTWTQICNLCHWSTQLYSKVYRNKNKQ